MLKHEVISAEVWAELLVYRKALRSIVAQWSLDLVPPAPTQSASSDIKIKIIVKFLENS